MRSKVSWLLGALVLTAFLSFIPNKKLYFPDKQWEQYTNPEELGFDTILLPKTRQFCDSTRAASLLVIYKGKVLMN